MAAIENVRIPYGAYWSTPFSKWQNSFADLHSIRFAAHVAKEALAEREIDPQSFDHAVMGITTPQESSFFGLPWLMKMIGNDAVPGTQVSQACATGARVLQTASFEIERGMGSASLCVAADRTSNGPVLSYPSPSNPGGAPDIERWPIDGFEGDPLGGPPMVGTAENCARDWQVSTEEQHDVVVRRWEQYEMALEDDHAFQKGYMNCPSNDRTALPQQFVLEGDEGVRPLRARPARLKPVRRTPVTFGGQAIRPTERTVSCDGQARAVEDPHRHRVARLRMAPEAGILAGSAGCRRRRKALDRRPDDRRHRCGETHNPFASRRVFAREPLRR